jgi:hypothetical protein
MWVLVCPVESRRIRARCGFLWFIGKSVEDMLQSNRKFDAPLPGLLTPIEIIIVVNINICNDLEKMSSNWKLDGGWLCSLLRILSLRLGEGVPYSEFPGEGLP